MGKHTNTVLDERGPRLGRGGRAVAVAGIAGAGLIAAAGPAMATESHGAQEGQQGHSQCDHGSTDRIGSQHGHQSRDHEQRSGGERGHASPISDVTSTVTTLVGGNGGSGGNGTGGAGGAGGAATGGLGGVNVLSGSNLGLLGHSAPSTNVSKGGDASANGGDGGHGIGGGAGDGHLQNS
ncbi:hypothetical protein [Actinomycetospora sp. TBRC 11914]|uniref:hypothetical protein n=1 Tax=Actinomycetospora sp. TBRC 11914 TaxID=2729387 RepID=UPI00145D073F|nr:hypothetical protein [Actinomycetospora sp. TBRC 11914]NMO94050.1 hypothetical protein [Actinomycetospora sp. TBRC 11914]